MTSLSFQDIGLKPATLKAVEKKAKVAGKSPVEYVRALIERDLLADRSFDEVLRPIRNDVRAAGVSPDDLDGIVRRARAATAPKSKRTGR